MQTSNDASSQTSDILLEDEVDALRINTFLPRGVNRRINEKETFQNETKSKEDIQDKAMTRKTTKGKVSVSQPKIKKQVVGPTEEECYAMGRYSKGICMIISNENFHPSLQLNTRKGSEVDLKSATELFTGLGYEVRVYPNQPYKDLMNSLDRVATMENHDKFDSVVIVVLSHGNEGTIYAYDKPFATNKLWEPFTAENSPSLAGKPKLFFIQACQGGLMDEGVTVVESHTETDSSAFFASYKVPIHSDFLIYHSTISGYYSWRNTMNGSWFIQALASVFKDYGEQQRDLMSLLTIVSKRVSIEYESSSSKKEFNNKKQTPFFYSTLRYKIYLHDD